MTDNSYSTLIDCTDLGQHIADDDWVIIDCRYNLVDPAAGRQDYLQAHITGAVFADVHEDLSGPPLTDRGRHPLPAAAQLQALFRRLGINRQSQVVVYDDSGGAFAARLWWLLRYMGHTRVALLDGGWQAWLAGDGKTAAGEKQNAAGEFTGAAAQSWLVTVAEVPSVPLLIDARDAVRYRGEEEPLDSKAGHIPGAVNRPWKSNLDADGFFKDKDQLRREFSVLLADRDVASVAMYCGSGVTACHNLLAATHAGLPMPRLYAGSWSDWCADVSRPIASGAAPGNF